VVKTLSLDLRRRIVAAYTARQSGTYEATAKLFDVGQATVSRLLRRKRETGDVTPKKKGGNNPRRIDLAWLRKHLEAAPDARLVDRVEAWEKESGRRVGINTMWKAVRACGWTHKKRRSTPASWIGPTSRSGG
jgi:transposase